MTWSFALSLLTAVVLIAAVLLPSPVSASEVPARHLAADALVLANGMMLSWKLGRRFEQRARARRLLELLTRAAYVQPSDPGSRG